MKTKLTIIVLLTFSVFFMITRNANGQVQHEPIIVKTEIVQFEENSMEWKLYLDYDSLNIFYKRITCTEDVNGAINTFIVLRLDNNSSEDYKLEWEVRLFSESDLDAVGDTDKRAFRSLLLAKKSFLEGKCNGPNLRIYLKSSNHVNSPNITKFQLAKMSFRIADEIPLEKKH